MSASGLLIFISGPSGVGKSTLCRRLAADLPAEFAVSATTRPGKPQDALGKKYLFVTENIFRQMLEAGEFLEYAYKFDNWYGTLRKPVEDGLEAGHTILFEVEVQGAIQIRKMFPVSLGIFVLPPSMDDLKHRLEVRKRDDEATILRRLTEAQQEIRSAQACGIYNLMVVNEDNGIDKTIKTIKRTIKTFRRDEQNRLF
ncbi:MAG: guanylate kinase [Phycisphaerales bacterium]|nr:guanylate kinase [Phycisphaerales bacterium]